MYMLVLGGGGGERFADVSVKIKDMGDLVRLCREFYFCSFEDVVNEKICKGRGRGSTCASKSCVLITTNSSTCLLPNH